MAPPPLKLLGGEIVVSVGALSDSSVYINRLDPYTIHLVYDVMVEEWANQLEDSLGLKVHRIPLRGGEGVKSLEGVKHIWLSLLKTGATRDSLVIAMGGGSILDAAGFAASTYMRGCKLAYIPTTLLAQADAAIGGKNGINLEGKNIIGTFRIPELTIIDPEVLESLPEDSYVDGLAEVVKHAVIGGKWFMELLVDNVEPILSRDTSLLEKVIYHSVSVKASIVERDPFERWDRMILNYGHTIGHALEKASNYTISHGKAVSIGMSIEGLIASKLTGFPLDELNLQNEVLEKLKLPTYKPGSGIDLRGLLEHMGMDKKFRRGRPRLPLPVELGSFKIVELEWRQLWRLLETLER
ncbi:MAG: 3-dehydroquinate synthase [Desulfurococcales archaeon]|nr:3-dehydroquinate synthase [Desulfurococcales archaeon]